MFLFDETKHRIIDLSCPVSPPGTADRPLRAERAYLADGSFKHDVATHTHVGTHIESPAHFFENARCLEDYPLNAFYGRAVLFEFSGIDREPIRSPAFEADIGPLMRDHDIVVFRNNHPDWRRIHAENRKRLPYLAPDGARWLVERRAKMIVADDFTGLRLADGKEISRQNHTILFAPRAETLVLEFADGLEQVTQKEFFFMALPVRFERLDSVWTRAFAIEERS